MSQLSLLKCGLTAPKSLKLVFFGINLTKRLGEGLPSLHPHVKFYRCGFKICVLTATKIAKIGNFWYIFAPKGYIPLSNFYKIWRGGANFRHSKAWQKTDRQTDRQKTSHFLVYSRRATQDRHYTWHDDRAGPSLFCTPLTFCDSSSSFAVRGYWKLVGKCPHRGKMLITLMFVPRKRPN